MSAISTRWNVSWPGRGGDDPLFGVTWPSEQSTEIQRKAQAQVVRDSVNPILDADPGALVVVAGEGADHPLAILEGRPGEAPLTNLIMLEKDAERCTYAYDGNSQVLDHLLVSPALPDLLVATDILRFDAGYPEILASDPSTPLRISDHDPVEGRFVLGKVPRARGK